MDPHTQRATRHLFEKMEARLKMAGSGNPKRAVEELVAQGLGCKPLEIYFKTITPEQQAELEALIVRAEHGEPIQYIIGHVNFRGLDIHCDPRALIPRPETEQLVEKVLQTVRKRESETQRAEQAATLRIADVGTGTGCMALALLSDLPNAEVTGIDVSSEALTLARKNAERLGLSERFQTLENNLLDGFKAASLDIVVSNPPYISSKEWTTLERCVRDFEPRLALDGGATGLDLISQLVSQAARVLKPGGDLFLEIGFDQGKSGFQCLEQQGFYPVEIQKDLAGLDRILHGKKPCLQNADRASI